MKLRDELTELKDRLASLESRLNGEDKWYVATLDLVSKKLRVNWVFSSFDEAQARALETNTRDHCGPLSVEVAVQEEDLKNWQCE